MPVPGWFTLTDNPGGAPITFTDGGSGTSLVGAVPEGIKAWTKVRIGALYQHREEMATAGRGEKIEPLPFMDRLLDPYRVVF